MALRLFLSIAVALVVTPSSYGEDLRLANFVDSHMVLQREPQRARVWGWATPAANVTANLNDGESVETTVVGPDGSWLLDLPPQLGGDGHTIDISDGTTTIQLEDIAFGDVYLCSGQSNMEFSLLYVFNADAEIEDSINYPNLRLATVEKVTADSPQTDAPARGNYTWARSGPKAVNSVGVLADDAEKWVVYSATCYLFGRELYKSLGGKIPIGLVTSCWEGQTVEAFSSPDALADATCGGTRLTNDIYDEEVSSVMSEDDRHDISDHRENYFYLDPSYFRSKLWNAMVYPLLPMRFSGVVWYQGEANANNAVSYACRFPAMIADWRVKFDLPDLSFSYVELAGYELGKTWPYMRAAQAVALQLPKVGFATAIDLSDPESPLQSIHPRRKQEVGRRLSLTARAIKYEERADLVYTGPKLADVQLDSEPTITLSFCSGTAAGLHFQGAAACVACCREPPFQVLGSNGNWTRVINSQVRDGEDVMLLSTVDKVLGIRYAWEPRPECVLYNGQGGPDDHAGLAAAPFEWCAYPSGKGAWTGQGCKLRGDPMG